jgi:hypothetical protein
MSRIISIYSNEALSLAEKTAYHAVHQVLASGNFYRSPEEIKRYCQNAVYLAASAYKEEGELNGTQDRTRESSNHADASAK